MTKKAIHWASETGASSLGLNSFWVSKDPGVASPYSDLVALLFHLRKNYNLCKDSVLQGGACCAWSLQAAIEKMDSSSLIMSEEAAEFTYQSIRRCLLHWQGMKAACVAAKVLRWGFRPKHHFLEHMAESVQRTRLNPQHLACWQDESFLGYVKHVATKCHSATAILRIFQRLTLNLRQRFEQTRRGGFQKPENWRQPSLKQVSRLLG